MTMPNKIKLKVPTSAQWLEAVLESFDDFLLDHAAAEKKASGMAMSMVSHYPDRPELIDAMTKLAIEELNHFREVVKIIYDKGLILVPDKKDQYMNSFRRCIRDGKEEYFLDRLLIASIVEARGAERFGLIANALPEGIMKNFYREITLSEEGHLSLFYDLAVLYFPVEAVNQRLDELLSEEEKIIKELPIRVALH